MPASPIPAGDVSCPISTGACEASACVDLRSLRNDRRHIGGAGLVIEPLGKRRPCSRSRIPTCDTARFDPPCRCKCATGIESIAAYLQGEDEWIISPHTSSHRRPCRSVPACQPLCGHPSGAVEYSADVEHPILEGEGAHKRRGAPYPVAERLPGRCSAVPARHPVRPHAADAREIAADIEPVAIDDEGMYRAVGAVAIGGGDRIARESLPGDAVPGGDMMGGNIAGRSEMSSGEELVAGDRQRPDEGDVDRAGIAVIETGGGIIPHPPLGCSVHAQSHAGAEERP
jgi:hypothetical protein